MVFRYMPRHSVEANGIPVEARGVSAVARGVSVECRGNNHGMPWWRMGTAAVLRQKDKSCTSACCLESSSSVL